MTSDNHHSRVLQPAWVSPKVAWNSRETNTKVPRTTMELASPVKYRCWCYGDSILVSWDMKMYFMILCFGFLIVLLWFLFLAWLIVVVYYNESVVVVVDVFDGVGMEIHGFLSLKLIVMHVLFVCRNTVFPFVFFVFVMCFIALLFWIESSAWDFWYLLIIYYIHQSYTYKHNATKTASVGDKIMFNNMQLLVFFGWCIERKISGVV